MQTALRWNSHHNLTGFYVWLVVAIVAYFNLPARLAIWLAGRVPRLRKTTGWSNASWFVEQGEGAPSFVLARGNRGAISEKLLLLVSAPEPNPRMALRPPGLEDDEAANVLFFGHVLEEYISQTSGDRRQRISRRRSTLHRLGGATSIDSVGWRLRAAFGAVLISGGREVRSAGPSEVRRLNRVLREELARSAC